MYRNRPLSPLIPRSRLENLLKFYRGARNLAPENFHDFLLVSFGGTEQLQLRNLIPWQVGLPTRLEILYRQSTDIFHLYQWDKRRKS